MFKFFFCFVYVGFVVSSPTPKLEDVRIVGGQDIDIADAPYQVSVLYRGRHTCGGTIVGEHVIVTAAHCIMGADPKDYQIRAGSSFSSREGKLYSVGDLIAHEDFNVMKLDNDVAVIWVNEPIIFGKDAAPIDLFDKGEEIEDGDATVVTGWGYTMEGGNFPTKLQKVLVPKVNEEKCSSAYFPMYTITPRMLCAGIPEGGKDACQGDSGGPLVFNNKLAGVVSWGLGCARPDYPGVYAKVSALRSWIDDSITYLRLKHVFRVL